MEGAASLFPPVRLPKVCLARQNPPAEKLSDPAERIKAVFEQARLPAKALKGLKVGLTVGSRGITDIATIIKTIAEQVKEFGGTPILIPSMGSHGGATAAGQLQLLAGLGITPESTGVPIASDTTAYKLGTTDTGIPVYINSSVKKVDRLIVINRIKPHTDFSGSIESGLCKMLAIGLGSHRGAVEAHSSALRLGYEETITVMASFMLQKLPLLFGIGILENWRGETNRIELIHPEELIEKEKALLEKAKELVLRLPFHRLDALVIKEIGKEISGTGMDTKVVGRIMIIGQKEPETPIIGRIAALDLTASSHGNALGIGLADFTTRRLFDAFDPRVTAINGVSSMGPEQSRLPCVLDNDREAIEASVTTLGLPDPSSARLVIIRNTAKLAYLYISATLLDEVKNISHMSLHGPLEELEFDRDGNLAKRFSNPGCIL